MESRRVQPPRLPLGRLQSQPQQRCRPGGKRHRRREPRRRRRITLFRRMQLVQLGAGETLREPIPRFSLITRTRWRGGDQPQAGEVGKRVAHIVFL